MKKIITIEDIAKKAGVGKGTVDRVIHNRGRVADETRERVLKCIDELQYKPNKAARMLAKKKNYKIAVTYHDEENEFWAQIGSGIKKASDEYEPLGVAVDSFIISSIDVDKQLEIIQYVIDNHYDGLAIVPYASPQIVELLNEAIKRGIAVMTFNNQDSNINCGYVGMDGKQSGKTAGRMLSLIAGKDCKYIIISAHNELMAQIDERSESFRETVKKYRSDIQLIDNFSFLENHQIVYQEVRKLLLEKADVIDAIYVTTATTGTVAKAIKDASLDKKIICIGHDLTETNVSYMKQGIIDIAIGQEPERQGYLAISQICKKLLTDEVIDDDIYTRISIIVAENMDYI